MTSFTPQNTQAISMQLRRAALLCLATWCAAGAASAAEPATVAQLPRVVVEGRAQLLDVCPGAETQIRQALEGAVWRYQIAIAMPVRFTLQGSRISDVEVGDGPKAYALRLRHALSGLQCSGPQHAAQVHAFSVDLLTS